MMKNNKKICTIICAMMIMMTACGNTEVEDVKKNDGNNAVTTTVIKEDEPEVVTDSMDVSSDVSDNSSRVDESSSSKPEDSSKMDSSSKNESSSRSDNSSKKDDSSKNERKKNDSSSKSETKTTTVSSKTNTSSNGNSSGNTTTVQKTNTGNNNGNSNNTGNSGNSGNTQQASSVQPVQQETKPAVTNAPEPAAPVVTDPPVVAQPEPEPQPEPQPVQLTEDGYDPREYARLRGGALVHTNKPYDGFADDIHYYLSWVNDLSDVELAYFNFEMGCMTDQDWQIICDDCWNYIRETYSYLPNVKFEDTDEYYVVFDEDGHCLDWKGGFGFGVSGCNFFTNDRGENCVDENDVFWYYEDFSEEINYFHQEAQDAVECHHYTEDDNCTQYIHFNYYYHGPGRDYVFIAQHY